MNKIIFVIIAISLFLIASCDSIRKDKSITDVDVRTGIKGLTMEFIKNAPPNSIFEDGVFPIAIELRNSGATDIVDDEETNDVEKGILVFGFETTYADIVQRDLINIDLADLATNLRNGLSIKDLPALLKSVSSEFLKNLPSQQISELSSDILSPMNEFDALDTQDKKDNKVQQLSNILKNIKERKEFQLEGRSTFNPNGDEEVVTVNAQAKQIGGQSEKRPSTILATACYPYKTVFGASVCIDTDILGDRKGQKACSISDLIFGDGQGAPVAITKIETRMLPQDKDNLKPQFLIHVENKGNGQVVALDKVEQACSNERLDHEDFNAIKVKAELSGKPLDCRIDRIDTDPPPAPAEIRLRDKVNIIRCTLEQDPISTSREAYVSLLSIELVYGYTFTISKNIIIEKILTY